MGFLDKLLGVLKRSDVAEEEIVEEEAVTMPLVKLDKWLDDRNRKAFDSILPDIKEAFELISDQKEQIKFHLKELEEAELRNTKIPEREFQLMQGNRKAFIQQYDIFVDRIRQPKELSPQTVADFTAELKQQMDRLAKSTARSAMILKEFFANHTVNISKSLKTMLDTVNSINDLLERGSFDEARSSGVASAVNELKSKKKLADDIDHELKSLKSKLSNSKQMKEKIESNMYELKQTEDFQKFSKTNDEKESLKKERKQVEDEISAMFSQIDRPMRKYERIITQDVDTFQDYTRNPVTGLEKDTNLKILSILKNMRVSVADNTLGFKDKDKDKALARIESITEPVLSGLQKRYSEIKHKIKELNDQIASCKVLQELDDLKYKLEHVVNQIELLSDKIDKAMTNRSKIDLESMRNDVVKKIHASIGVEVDITWQQEDSQEE